MSTAKIDLREWVRLSSTERQAHKDAVFSFTVKARPSKGILKSSRSDVISTPVTSELVSDKTDAYLRDKIKPVVSKPVLSKPVVSKPPVDLREKLKLKRAAEAAQPLAKKAAIPSVKEASKRAAEAALPPVMKAAIPSVKEASKPTVDLREKLRVKRADAAAAERESAAEKEAAKPAPKGSRGAKAYVRAPLPQPYPSNKYELPPGITCFRPMKADVSSRDDKALKREACDILRDIIATRKRQLEALENGEIEVQRKPNPFKREWDF